MPVQHAIWTIGDQSKPLAASHLPSEQTLESMIVRDPRILSREWMLIGRQEPTGLGGRIDLLAIAPDSSLVLIELKRDRTPRDVVAQALDYASWVEQLTADRIAQIFERFAPGRDLGTAFQERFGAELDEDALNESHQIVLVAAQLDTSTERIITYLNDKNVAINVLFFQVFKHGDELLLSRAWFIDPGETQANVMSSSSRGEKEPWNGEFYVSFSGKHRVWEEARRYGFISGGGGSWYSQTLKLLSPGDRVWVNVPKRGYVGVGRVVEGVLPLADFTVPSEGAEVPVVKVLQHGDAVQKVAADPERAEHFVRIEWLDTVPESSAHSEIGLFGNQNTVCQPRTPKWRHTVERLKTVFPKWNRVQRKLVASTQGT